MFPTLEIPGLGTLYVYGALLVTAYIVGVIVGGKLGRSIQGMPERRTWELGLVLVVGGMTGAWLGNVMVETFAHGKPFGSALSTSPAEAGAGVFYGGLLVGIGSMLLWAWYRGLHPWHALDPFVTAVPLGQAIGRLGCFSAGCCWGKPTTLPWAVRFPEKAHQITGVPTGVPLHPVQLYAVGAHLVLFTVLFLILRRKRFGGQIVLIYFVLYGVLRFCLEMLRDDPRGFYPGGLSTSQGISIVLILLAVALWPVLRRRGLPSSPYRDDRKPAGGRK